MSPPDVPSDADTPKVPASGDLAQYRPEQILRFCEAVRFSGSLGFTGPGGRGVLPMLNGVTETDESNAQLEAALDAFITMERGNFTLTQMLPTLEGATMEADLVQRGTLGTLMPPDLLRYCESAGLTGALTLSHDNENCEAKYRRGELASLTLDGAAGDNIDQVFGWTTGKFEIRAQSVFETRPPESPPEQQLLKTLEMALTEIMSQGDRTGAALKRPSTMRPPSILRGSTLPFGMDKNAPRPPRPSSVPPTTRAVRSIPPPPPENVTVKVYLVRPAGAGGPSNTQHATGHMGSEVVQLDPQSQRIEALDAAAARKIAEAAVTPPASDPQASPEAPAPTPNRMLANAAVPLSQRERIASLAFAAAFLLGVFASLYILVGLLLR